jgi:type IV pilus assembly protein PilY1
VVSRLARLTSPSYAHEYFVDGEMVVSSAEETPGQNILVASLGRGGKTLFALDVSNPGAFSAANVLWEFSDSDLGLVLGKPFIARLNSGRAAVIVGNGVNSGNEHAVLFIIDALTGALIRKIDTGAGSAAASNGLSSPRGWDADANGTPDQVYAGDLLGNLWKFDLSGSSPSAWDARVTAGGARVPLFVATDSAGNRQPITGSVGLGLNSRKNDPNYGKRYVFFGTGRYIVAADVSDRSVQSWYGLIDDGLTAIAARSALRERTIELESGSGNNTVRGFSVSSAGDMSGRRGWVLDFRSPVSGAQGERIIGESTFAGQVLLASSLLPSSNICTPGGDGFLNAIDPFSGANLSVPLFDINNDLKFTDIDRIGSDKRAIGSINPKVNLPSDAVLIGNRLIVSGTSGSVSSNSVHNPVRSGRIAWREIVR